MGELQILGVEIHALGTMTIERVALNGRGETFAGGAMDTKLVGAACVRHERKHHFAAAKIRRLRTDNTPLGDGALAVLVVYHLMRTVERIGTQREVDCAVVALFECNAYHWLYNRHIALLDRTVEKLTLKVVVGFYSERHDKEAGGVHVKTMYDLRSVSTFEKQTEQR